MSRVSNQPKKVRQQVRQAVKDGRVTRGEARNLAKAIRRDGVTQAEQKVLNGALTRRNDLFEPAAQRRLAQVADFTPGENIARNSPDQVRAEFRRADYRGNINLEEAERISRRLRRGGATTEEYCMLQRQLDKHSGSLTRQARESLESWVRELEPVVPGPQVQQVAGLELRGTGVRQSAMDELGRLARELTAHRPDIAQRLSEAGQVVVIIPVGAKLTDLPEFAALKGGQTFDGRNWEDVRGVAGVTGPDGRTYTAIAEENLSDLRVDGYGNESVGLHELAHVIHLYGLAPEEQGELDALYEAAQARGGPFSSDYGSNNVAEYFAELAGTYFSRSQSSDAPNAAWISQHDPAAYALLQRIFGPPRVL